MPAMTNREALMENVMQRQKSEPSNPNSSQFKNNHSTEMCIGSEAGSYLRRIDSCITQLKAQGPSRTCNESKEEEEEIWLTFARIEFSP